ncbi:hypothetical protein CALCODRAFT_500303 [Calocera cornea HHB12733]|uniref:WW domain-containing protein n=1 Tax=Calocera cornea HHB12733 TaxID=1353952 RepID=A0A165E456_9BASI|nr:hypothetical protein CALCODRAFT_500303 [Calocera cornea HHB12733]
MSQGGGDLVYNHAVDKIIRPGARLWSRLGTFIKGKGFLPEGWERQDTNGIIGAVDKLTGTKYQLAYTDELAADYHPMAPLSDFVPNPSVSYWNPFTGRRGEGVPLPSEWEVKWAIDEGTIMFFNRDTGERRRRDPRQNPDTMLQALPSRRHEPIGRNSADRDDTHDLRATVEEPSDYVSDEELPTFVSSDDKPRAFWFDDVYRLDQNDVVPSGSTSLMGMPQGGTPVNITQQSTAPVLFDRSPSQEEANGWPSFADIYETPENGFAAIEHSYSPRSTHGPNPFRSDYLSAEYHQPRPSKSEVPVTPSTFRGGKPRRRVRAYLSDL